jgi:restriction system protein
MTEVLEMNQELDDQIESLENLLTGSLSWNPSVNFEALKVHPNIPKLDLSGLERKTEPPSMSSFEPKRPHPLVGWIPAIRKSYEAKIETCRKAHGEALAAHATAEVDRRNACEKRVNEHRALEASLKADADKKNAEVDQWRSAIEACEKDAVESYFDQILGASPYPDGFPQDAKLAFVKESRQLVVEYDLPVIDAVIPAVKSYSYVKSTDSINETARPEKQRRSLYASVIAQTALRCLREVFAADAWGHIETVVLNGVVSTKDPATGKPIRPCLVTVRTTRERFMDLDHSELNPVAALQYLSASFSKSPAELAPVRPLLEFNMVDPRFIKEADVMSSLDQRQNLMDLSPGDFESLITNLFQKMGLETRLTQASRDGGVDCVAFDPRPISGARW